MEINRKRNFILDSPLPKSKQLLLILPRSLCLDLSVWLCLPLVLFIFPTLSHTPATSSTHKPPSKPTLKNSTPGECLWHSTATTLSWGPQPGSRHCSYQWSSWAQMLHKFFSQQKSVPSTSPQLDNRFSDAPKWDLRNLQTNRQEGLVLKYNIMRNLKVPKWLPSEIYFTDLFYNIINSFNTSSSIYSKDYNSDLGKKMSQCSWKAVVSEVFKRE